MALSPIEKVALQRLAAQERIPLAAVVRRLIWREARRLNIVADQHAQVHAQASQETRGDG